MDITISIISTYLFPSLLLSLLHVFGLLSEDGSVLPEDLAFDYRVKSDSLGSRRSPRRGRPVLGPLLLIFLRDRF